MRKIQVLQGGGKGAYSVCDCRQRRQQGVNLPVTQNKTHSQIYCTIAARALNCRLPHSAKRNKFGLLFLQAICGEVVFCKVRMVRDPASPRLRRDKTEQRDTIGAARLPLPGIVLLAFAKCNG